MSKDSQGIAPEDEVLEGVIIEDEDTDSPAVTQENLQYSSTPQERMEDSLHQNAGAVNATAMAAHDLKHDSLEETTANIKNLKRMLGGFL